MAVTRQDGCVRESGEKDPVGERLRRVLRESPIYDGLRPRRTRRPLDWGLNFRIYIVLGFLVLAVPYIGLLILLTWRWWERPFGLVLLMAGCLPAFGLVQWLRRPVDPEALAALRRTQQARGRFGGIKTRRPPRFRPGSPNSTQLPPSRPEE
jgi:hypothetical protein